MSIEDFKGLMDAFEPASLLPELDAVIGKLALLARIVVLVGPAAILLMGLVYLFAVPKEANYYIGYRCYYGMGSVEAWRFTQRMAGFILGGLGLVLTGIMLILSAGFAGMEIMDMVWRAVSCLIWEVVLVALATAAINITVMVRYDRKGNLRKQKEE